MKKFCSYCGPAKVKKTNNKKAIRFCSYCGPAKK